MLSNEMSALITGAINHTIKQVNLSHKIAKFAKIAKSAIFKEIVILLASIMH